MVAQYYSIAPEIAERLTEPAELEQVWQVIHRCVEAIHASCPEQAIDEYRAMVQRLQQSHLNEVA